MFGHLECKVSLLLPYMYNLYVQLRAHDLLHIGLWFLVWTSWFCSLDNIIAFQTWLFSRLQFKLENPVAIVLMSDVADVEVSSESCNT